MKNKIYIIEVKNNENQAKKRIIQNIKEKKISYIKNESHTEESPLGFINISGPSIILKSSGSSGKPRKCIHYIDNLKLSAKTSGKWLEKQGFELKNCIIFNTLPLFHISGLMPIIRSQVWRCKYIDISPTLLKNNRKLLLYSLQFKSEKKQFITSLVPTQLKRLLEKEDGIRWLKLFDLIWIGGASIPSDISEQCRQEKVNLAPCYGSTETAAMVTSLKPKEFLIGFNNVGEILPDTNLRINKKGLIEIKSQRIGIELTESFKTSNFRNKNGWWETSDLGKIKKSNNSTYLKFIGRVDNAFNSGGEIVFPEVIKSRLNDFIMRENIPIKNFKISKIPNKIWENRVEIIIEFKKEINDKYIKHSLEILENFSKKWPKHERPENWIINKKKEDIQKKSFLFKK